VASLTSTFQLKNVLSVRVWYGLRPETQTGLVKVMEGTVHSGGQWLMNFDSVEDTWSLL
jgi:hypothetical protein